MGIVITPTDWDDWRWAGNGVNPPGAAVPATLTEVASGQWHWVFSNDSVMAFPDQQISHDYCEGTDIQPHIHFVSTTTATYTGTWTAIFNLWLAGTAGTAKESPLTLTAAFNESMTAGVEKFINFNSVIPGTGRKISSNGTILLSLALSAGTSVAMTGFDGHYQKDRLGSKTISSKT